MIPLMIPLVIPLMALLGPEAAARASGSRPRFGFPRANPVARWNAGMPRDRSPEGPGPNRAKKLGQTGFSPGMAA